MNPFLGQQQLGQRKLGRRQLGGVRRSWGQRLMLIFNLTLIIASLIAAALLNYANDRASSVNRVALDRSLTELPEGEPGSRVINILLVGSDSSANLAADDPIQIGRQGERLGDVIIVAHLDERSSNVALMSLPRDLWLPLAGTERVDRINRAFLVGGAATLIDTIEEAFDIPIHHYVNVDFAGFQGLVEAVGSVEVYFDTPARDWNVGAKPQPRSQTGFLVATAGCHSLDAEQALAYVRSRYYQTQREDGTWVTDPTSDLGRIRRQQDFLQRLMQQAIEVGARNPLVLADLIDTGIQNVAIDQDLTPALLIDLSATYRSFEPGDLHTYTFPVIDGTVGANEVLIPQVDEAEPLLKLFRGEPFSEPSTVGLELVYDPALLGVADGPTRPPLVVAAVVANLTVAGFDVGQPSEASIEAGLVIRHSADGGQAAELVASALGTSVKWVDATGSDRSATPILEPTTALSGRNVVVAIGSDLAPTPLISDLAAPAWTASRQVRESEVANETGTEGDEGELTPLGPTYSASDLGESNLVTRPEITAPPTTCG